MPDICNTDKNPSSRPAGLTSPTGLSDGILEEVLRFATLWTLWIYRLSLSRHRVLRAV